MAKTEALDENTMVNYAELFENAKDAEKLREIARSGRPYSANITKLRNLQKEIETHSKNLQKTLETYKEQSDRIREGLEGKEEQDVSKLYGRLIKRAKKTLAYLPVIGQYFKDYPLSLHEVTILQLEALADYKSTFKAVIDETDRNKDQSTVNIKSLFDLRKRTKEERKKLKSEIRKLLKKQKKLEQRIKNSDKTSGTFMRLDEELHEVNLLMYERGTKLTIEDHKINFIHGLLDLEKTFEKGYQVSLASTKAAYYRYETSIDLSEKTIKNFIQITKTLDVLNLGLQQYQTWKEGLNKSVLLTGKGLKTLTEVTPAIINEELISPETRERLKQDIEETEKLLKEQIEETFLKAELIEKEIEPKEQSKKTRTKKRKTKN